MSIEALLAENTALKAALALRDQALAARDEELAKLRSEVEEIRRLLKRNSTNSSAPPSSDPPGVGRSKKPKSGKKRGGQPGHRGSFRARVPDERIDHHVPVPIDGPCGNCGSCEVTGRGVGRRHQTVELPEIRAVVTQYELERGRCACCKRRRSAAPPAEMPAGCMGPRAQALVATLTGTFGLSRRDAEQFLSEVLGIDVSLGTVSATEKFVSEAVAPLHQEAMAALRRQPVAGVDETGHRREGKRATTWVGTSPEVAVFLAGMSRARDVFFQLFGESFAGVITTDRYVVYDVIPPERRQLCWAHLKRAFKALLDEGGDAVRVGRRLLDNTKTVLKAVRAHRAGALSGPELTRTIDASKREMCWLLSDNRHLPGMRTILEAFVLTPESVWNFTTRNDLDATNNMAERDLRRFVIWRKTSFGSQSERGDRFIERMLTVVTTCRKQGQGLFELIVGATRAKLLHHAAPKLLPEPGA